MMKLGLLAALINFLIIGTFAQSRPKPPKDVLERFCRMDAEGALLSAEAGRETVSVFVSPFAWSRNQDVVVVDDYVIHGSVPHGTSAKFTVYCRVWGKIDASLRFAREEGRAPNKPIRDQQYYNLVLANRHNEVEPDGSMASVLGSPGWRIEATPSRPHITIDTAIRYVKEMRAKVSDPGIQENADKTTLMLKHLEKGERPGASVSRSPSTVVEEFSKMDAEGKQLASGGGTELADLFVGPIAQRQENFPIVIVKHFEVSNATISDDKARVIVEYIYLGELNSATALLTQEPVSGLKMLVERDLVLVDAGKIATGDAMKSQTWKIEGSLPEPHITIDTAVKYVSHFRESTSDPILKRNADKTLKRLISLTR